MKWKNNLIPAILATGMLATSASLAAPVLEMPGQLSQPDGSTFTAIPKGDEWNNRVETAAGFTVARDNAGVWRYVTGYDKGNAPVLSNAPAHLPAPPGLSKHLRSPATRPERAPGTGNNGGADSAPSLAPVQTATPVLFILTEFNDRKGSTTEADWASFVSDNVRDFYLQTSHGNAQMNPAAENSGTANNGVINWVNVGYNHPNTAGNTNTINQNLTADAIAAADPYVDYASYDSNGDGRVDGNELSVVVIVAGYETAYGGTSGTLSPSVWGHKWGWWNNIPSFDGVSMTEYAQFGELHATSLSNEHQATMGIMVHELGHLTHGLPDLYDTDGSSSGIGDFGVMSAGSWGLASDDIWAGETPVNACAWSKYRMNWVNAYEGSSTETIAASGSGTQSDTVFRASTGSTNEYFLVENRRPVGYDRGLEGSLGTGFSGGLAIWHIDDSLGSNANDSHRWVDLEEADGTELGSGDNSDLWTSGNGGLFDGSSDPSSSLYDGSDSGVVVANISSAADTMTADFGAVPSVPQAPTDLSANAVSSSEINLIWNDNANNEEGFRVERSEDQSNWTTVASGLAADSQSFNDTGLTASTTYYYRVTAYNAIGDSDTSNTANATTQAEPLIPDVPDSLIATDGADGTALISWSDVANETGYEVQREQAHKKRAGVWQSTTAVGTTAADITSLQDGSGTGTYRYRVRALGTGGDSGWTAWVVVDVTDATGGGGGGNGGGGGGDKPCRGKKCTQ